MPLPWHQKEYLDICNVNYEPYSKRILKKLYMLEGGGENSYRKERYNELRQRWLTT
ncbi:MAG: hypothetical protein ACI8VC_000498 [Candidatus Endobugula sp.]|jgi:hypothetical protein